MASTGLLICYTVVFFLALYSPRTLSFSLGSKQNQAILVLLRQLRGVFNELEWKLRKGEDADAGASSQGPYRSLDPKQQEIRLLIVEPGIGADPIECSFRPRYLRAIFKPQYETVSYVWGDASIRATVRLEGQESDVPASSERVLRHFRCPNTQRLLWIDALCINQADTQERSNQVALMYKIYSNTTHNLVWLGEDDNSTAEAAVACIRRLTNEMNAEVASTTNPKGMLWSDKGPARYPDHRPNFIPSEEETDILDIYYSSQWFQRLWVVQEVALSVNNTCYFGGSSCSLLATLRAARWLQHNSRYMPGKLTRHGGIQNASRMFELCDHRIGTYGSFRGRFGLLHILSDTFQLHALDPRDYIFAVLGLVRRFKKLGADPPDPQLLDPDYSKPVDQVLRDAAFYSICERQDLEIFHFATPRFGDLTVATVPGLPSWVPSWSRPWRISEKDPSQFTLSFYGASSTVPLNTEHTRKSSTYRLHLTGILVSKVEMRSKVITKERLRRFRGMKVEDMICSSFKSEGLNKLGLNSQSQGSLVMTITTGVNRRNQRSTKQECEAMSAAYDRIIGQIGLRDPDEPIDLSNSDNKLAIELHQTMHSPLKNRRLFTTRSGGLGVGPRDTECGDMIAILFGCKMPVVLRQKRTSSNEFEFVGLCYIHGIMDGEAVEEHRVAGREDIEFVLV